MVHECFDLFQNSINSIDKTLINTIYAYYRITSVVHLLTETCAKTINSTHTVALRVNNLHGKVKTFVH